MKLVIGSYVLDNVSSTAYEEFITYYQTTPASYITNNDIERWNTPVNLGEYATVSYVTDNFIEIEKSIASAMSYVNDKVDNIDIPEQDLSDYVTYSYLQDKNYLTGHQDLSSYATISYVTDKFREDESVWAAALNNLNTQLGSYVTNESLSQMGYISASEITQMGYITLNDIPEQTVDLSSYATISYVTGEIVKTEKAIASAVSYISDKVDSIGSIVIPEVDLSSYATISYVNQISYNSSAEIAQMSYNLMSYIIDNEKVTAGALTDLSYRMSYITPDIDLSAYVTKSDLSSYATKSYVNQKITSTYSYVTNNFIEVEKAIASAVSYVNDKIDSIEIPEVDLSDYVSYSYLEGKNYLTQHQDLSSYVKFSDIASMGYITQHQNLSEYVTKTELNQAGYLTEHQNIDLSSYATISYVTYELVKTEKATASAISYLSDKIDNIEIPSGGVDLSSYALKSELPFVCYNGAYILSYSYNNRASDSWEVGEGSVVIFKHSLNYNTKTGTGAVAIGDRVNALGQHSLAIGNQAQTLAQWAIASGFASQARGESSIALGRYVKTYDTGSAAIGAFNNATQGVSLFTVGDGTANDARHNALEITLNGYSYISKPCISYNSGWSEISYETWSFTLQDDSVVTKKILMF